MLNWVLNFLHESYAFLHLTRPAPFPTQIDLYNLDNQLNALPKTNDFLFEQT